MDVVDAMPRSDVEDGKAIELALLYMIIDRDPRHLKADMLVREMAGKSKRPGEEKAVKLAIDSLLSFDLAIKEGEVIAPSKAALRFAELPH